jgi:hypothetical protein
VGGGESFQEASDRPALNTVSEIKQRLENELDDARMAGDAKKIREITEKLEPYKKYKQGGQVVGRPRRIVVPQIERDRKAVSISLTRTLEAIQQQMPNFALHLMQSVPTEWGCWYYAPEQKPDWSF